jgi:hypothetical protein
LYNSDPTVRYWVDSVTTGDTVVRPWNEMTIGWRGSRWKEYYIPMPAKRDQEMEILKMMEEMVLFPLPELVMPESPVVDTTPKKRRFFFDD